MEGDELLALLGPLALAAASIAILLLRAFRRSHLAAAGVAIAGLLLSLIALPFTPSLAPRWPLRVTPLLLLDDSSLFFAGLLSAAGLAVAALSYGYLKKWESDQEEYYLLLVLATLGAVVLASSSHFASLFLGLEVLSVSLYVLIGYRRLSARSLEASLKYLVLASASAAFLVFGLALIYALRGTMDLAEVGRAARAGEQPLLFRTGLAMVMVGVGFKLAVVPFHMWTPDVYEGAPAPVTAFVATASKGAVLALLLRYFLPTESGARGALWPVLSLIAIASMLAGNLLALLQANVKRILAYSSIGHLGYLLVAFLAGGAPAVKAANYYLIAYFATTLAAFGVVSALSGPERDADSLEDFRGLFWRRPWTAAVFTASLLSLAGIPLTGGFLGKFYVVVAGVRSSLWLLVIVLVASSALGIYYYLRIVVSMYLPPPPERVEKDRVAAVTISHVESLVLGALFLIILWLGAYPGPVLDLIQGTVGSGIR